MGKRHSQQQPVEGCGAAHAVGVPPAPLNGDASPPLDTAVAERQEDVILARHYGDTSTPSQVSEKSPFWQTSIMSPRGTPGKWRSDDETRIRSGPRTGDGGPTQFERSTGGVGSFALPRLWLSGGSIWRTGQRAYWTSRASELDPGQAHHWASRNDPSADGSI